MSGTTVLFELLGVGSALVALGFLPALRHEAPGRDGRLTMAAILLLSLFFHVGNALEYGGVTGALDPIEDFLWVLMPALWGFFFYASGQESLTIRVRESEDRYRSLVELSPQAVFVHRAGEVLYANPAAAELLEVHHPARLVGMPLASYFQDPLRPDLRTFVDEPKEPSRGFREMIFRAQDGTRDVEVSSSPIEFLGKPAVQLIVNDITARKNAERALKTGGRVLESMVEGVCLSDEAGAILYTNPAQDDMFGYAVGELVGRSTRELHGATAAEGEKLFETIGKSVREKGSWVGELFNRRKDGSPFTTYSRITSIDLEGRRCLLCVAEDLSERKQLEAQLLQAQKMESVGRLAGGVAHDFNNLLTVISGSGEVALARAGHDAALRRSLERILEASGRASELTRQLLAFARKQRFSPRLLSLNDFVAEAETMLRRLIGEDVALRTRLEPGLWNVKADHAQLMQVLINLAVNARDAMPAGGELLVETRNRHFSASSDGHPLMAPGDYVSLAVSDSGTGMTEDVLRHLFEPFFTTKEPGKGTGLGLATCYGIVKQNDGFIWASSSPGKGSTFTVYLPRSHDQPEVLPIVPVTGERPQGSERVLVVEDETSVRTIVVEVLRTLGYEVLEANDGEEALALTAAAPGPIDLLVTDVIMPRMGGRKLAEKLREADPNLRVLYISGYPSRGASPQDALELGAVLLEKPFTPDALASKVREVLGAPSPAPPTREAPEYRR